MDGRAAAAVTHAADTAKLGTKSALKSASFIPTHKLGADGSNMGEGSQSTGG